MTKIMSEWVYLLHHHSQSLGPRRQRLLGSDLKCNCVSRSLVTAATRVSEKLPSMLRHLQQIPRCDGEGVPLEVGQCGNVHKGPSAGAPRLQAGGTLKGDESE